MLKLFERHYKDSQSKYLLTTKLMQFASFSSLKPMHKKENKGE